ncbi:hypothetical protein Kpol_1032p44 [Vanderwaltozyma polyspora DSM 70294]|uniref:CST complex subunit Stn1 N-terminal domain-containing protein n=1 Tax=Vanderwaltozyma polyspora (strain ATCC 22028 / DSM 70294 / BCRC 21397 / CBS 2163 / NBRC 10782 / NRRL Y-8283 / UCD 57-17) TaxID=436907 RepID=A7TGZ8_VANPO|nr:uncharacterized protein Kpol_1032p44 [Vanderwaltozyma polyspora DSM 70294]EDO18450.1 hypothetical protein Kpol_1032p44 [Vanderwaltozyma polyspora DSM 70294]
MGIGEKVSFYDRRYWKYCESYDTCYVPLLISDINCRIDSSKRVCNDIYGGLIGDVLFWGNRPLVKICVIGCVIGWRWKWIRNEEYLIIKIDDSSDKHGFLDCKCSKSVLLSSGIVISNGIGMTLKLFGKVGLRYCEFNITFMEYTDGLVSEVNHWRSSIQQRVLLQNPWEFDGLKYQEEEEKEGEVEEREENVTTSHPRITNNQIIVSSSPIEQKNFNDPLEIASPYREIEESMYDNGEISVIMLDSTDPVEVESDEDNFNEQNTNQAVLKILLNEPKDRISTVQLYQLPKFMSIINQISINRIRKENISHKGLEDIKIEVFYKLLKTFSKNGLIKYIDETEIDLSLLHKIYKNFQRQVSVLILLRCTTGNIDLTKLKQLPDINSSSNIEFADILQESIEKIAKSSPNLLKIWRIKKIDKNNYKLNFVYHQDRTSN